MISQHERDEESGDRSGDYTIENDGSTRMSEQIAAHPKSSPQTLVVNFNRQWSIVRPRLYRHLDAKYVESFFNDGSLRLSSFARFAQHPDEQLRDTNEGTGMRIGLGAQSHIGVFGRRGNTPQY